MASGASALAAADNDFDEGLELEGEDILDAESNGRTGQTKRPVIALATEKSFACGDKAVYPAHGVGEIIDITEQEIAGETHRFYLMRMLDNGMSIMIPVKNIASVGLRPVMSADEVEAVFDLLKGKRAAKDSGTWNRRHRAYMDKIKTGSVLEVAEVLRDLYVLRGKKDLSFCELKLLDQARQLLVKEVAVVKACSEEQIDAELSQIFVR